MDKIVNEMIQEYLSHCFLHKRRGTINNYRRNLTRFFLFIEKKPEEVCGEDVNRYLRYLKMQDLRINTVRLHQISIRMFFDWLWRKYNFSKPNPTSKLIPIREEITIPTILNPTDIIKMIGTCNVKEFKGRRNAAIITLLADTGIRVSEITKLKVGNIQLMENNFLLLVPRVKNFERQIPFGRIKECDLIAEYWSSYWQEIKFVKMWDDNHPLFITDGIKIKNTPLGPAGVWRIVKMCAKRAGISKRVYPHSFRHFFGTYSVINGTDIVKLKELMGHARVDTTMRYVHYSLAISGKVLEKTATAGMVAPPYMRGYVKILKQYIKSLNK